MRGLTNPSTDFSRVRDRREAIPLYVDIDLSSARTTDADALALSIAGNSFYIDANPSDGVCTVQFQDTNFDRATAPIYCGPGAIFNVPFTQVLIRNAAQAGKKIRIIYGVDIDFIAGSIASIQAQVSPTALTPTQTTKTVGTSSANLVAASGTRKYLLIQNNGATDIYLNFSGASATIADGVKVGAAGGFYESAGSIVTNAITAISSASNAAVIVVEG